MSALFALALVSSLLPFVVISRTPLTGFDLAFTSSGSWLGGKVRMFTLVAIWCEAVGLFLSLLVWRKRPTSKELRLGAAGVALAAALLLLLIREPLAIAGATYEAGYWLSLLALVGAGAVGLATGLSRK